MTKGVTRVAREGMDFEEAGGVIVDYVERKKQELLKKQQEQMDDGETKVCICIPVRPVFIFLISSKLRHEQSAFLMSILQVFNKRMQDENGQFPVWMGKKQQRKAKNKTKKNRKSNGRKDGW